MSRHRFTGPMDDSTKAFIASRTSIYMATVSETGWPYVQHRGGPVGFLHILENDTIGFADYHGNQQYISKGNLAHDDRVSLFMMDYPTRSRLKLIGHMKMIEAAEDTELAAALTTKGQGPVERLVTIKIAAIDWNCPKYIEPRYTKRCQ